jgi:hypothetical protein
MRKVSAQLRFALPIVFALLVPTFLRAQVQDIAQTAKKLKAIPVDSELLLTQFKHELRNLVAARLAGAAADQAPEKLQDSILNDRAAAGTELRADVPDVTRTGPLPEDAEFGFIQKITIAKPAEHQDLLVAVVTLQIPCGSDWSLYIWQWQKTA